MKNISFAYKTYPTKPAERAQNSPYVYLHIAVGILETCFSSIRHLITTRLSTLKSQ